MATNRIPGTAVSIFTVGGNTLIDALENGELVIETKDVEAKGIKDRWDFPWPVGSAWRVECEVYVETVAAIMAAAAGSDVVALALNTGANNYTGNALISTSTHTFRREDLQMQKVTFKGQGVLNVA